MSNGSDQSIEDAAAAAAAAGPTVDPTVYTPTEEVPDVIPPKARKFPLSSAPLPPGVTPETVKKSTPSVQ